jgi:hypothetical protein
MEGSGAASAGRILGDQDYVVMNSQLSMLLLPVFVQSVMTKDLLLL